MIGYVSKEDSYIAASTDNLDEINKCYEGTKLYLYDIGKHKVYHFGEWVNYVTASSGSGGGGNGVIENGSIVTEMFAENAKAPLAGIADSVESSGITDATTIGKSVLTAASVNAARTAIGAGTGNGTSNLVVSTTAPASLATAAAIGVGTTAARADHVHPFPTAANVGAAATSHTHTIANVTGLQAAIDAKLTGTKGVAVADSEAIDVEGLNIVVNALLASLRTSGAITT